MSFDFATAKANLRRTVHTTFGVEAYYQADSIDTPVEIRARWHNRLARPFGDPESTGYAEVIEGIDRIVLFAEDAQGNPLEYTRLGLITFPSIEGVVFELDHREPKTGPLEEVWAVTVKR